MSGFPTKYDPNDPNEAEVPLPNAPREPLSETWAELQPPLSHRGHGPGIVIFLPPPPANDTKKANTLDPEPVMKWAEEGYAVVGIRSEAVRDKAPKALGLGLEALKAHTTVSEKSKFAVFVYDPKIVEAVSAAVTQSSLPVCLLASYGAPIPSSCTTACIEHTLLGSDPHPTEDPSACPMPDPNYHPDKDTRRSYAYAPPSASPFCFVPTYSDAIYDKGAAALSHSRTLSFLKAKIGGPWFDLEKIWDQHTWYEFTGRSVAKTMGTMVAEPYVNHVPTLIGGTGRKELTAFYRDHFIFANPPDSELQVVSRTVGIDRIVDEFIFKCTHSTVWEWFLPGVPPTGRNLRVPFIAVVCIRGDRLYHEHIWWDQACALRQVGVLPDTMPCGQGQHLRLPVAGAEAADKLQHDNVPCNDMLTAKYGVLSQLP